MKQGHKYIWTDGSSLKNPGPSGYGIVILDGFTYTTIQGGITHATNNVAELMAVIVALEYLKPCEVTIITDSYYVIYGIRRIENNTLPITNVDYWKRYRDACVDFDVKTEWTKGHSGDPFNEICDKLAYESANKVKVDKLKESISYFFD